jgi:hypothetical protein
MSEIKAKVVKKEFGWEYLEVEGIKDDYELSAVVAGYIKQLQKKIRKLENES